MNLTAIIRKPALEIYSKALKYINQELNDLGWIDKIEQFKTYEYDSDCIIVIQFKKQMYEEITLKDFVKLSNTVLPHGLNMQVQASPEKLVLQIVNLYY